MTKVLVIGDVMIDKHVRGEVRRISPEAPVPVINVVGEPETSIGAAGYVAAQIAEAGIETTLCYKDNEDDVDLEGQINGHNINPMPLAGANKKYVTTTKTRIWTGNQQICRIDNEDIAKPSAKVQEEWIEGITDLISHNHYDCVVFSDYDKGTLTDHIIQSVTNVCKNSGALTILDPKRYSYFGLQNLFLIKPNKHEVDITNMDAYDVSKHLSYTYLLNTLGEKGMKLFYNGSLRYQVETPKITVRDVCGAGDITTAMLAISLVKHKDDHQNQFGSQRAIERAMRHASTAAAMAILHEGCYIINNDVIKIILEHK